MPSPMAKRQPRPAARTKPQLPPNTPARQSLAADDRFRASKVDLKKRSSMIVQPSHSSHVENIAKCRGLVTLGRMARAPFLDLPFIASQTSSMAHTYMVFEFPNEEKAQQARHKLEGWKQAFRLDKKLQVKFDRGDEAATEAETAAAEPGAADEPKKGSKGKAATKSPKPAKSKKADDAEKEGADSKPVKLLVRLYFSGHEKITEKQWLERIPADELFKVAQPHVIREKDAAFDGTLKQFDSLE
jgi:hypothetical protein